MKVFGNVHKYGDHVDTDVIIPARYLNIADINELAGHCMEDIDKDFIKNVQKGDVIVAGRNFGCGSSREHAPLVIKQSGVACIIAKSFARIFFRNAINIGLPVLECAEVYDDADSNDRMEVDLTSGTIKNITKNKYDIFVKTNAIPTIEMISRQKFNVVSNIVNTISCGELLKR